MIYPNTVTAGLSYFTEGARLLAQPGLKRFVLIPLLANVVVFFILTATLIQYYTAISGWIEDKMDFWSWLTFLTSFIAALLSALVIFLILVIYGFSFNIITNIIGAPFYGFLAEKIEYKISGLTAPEESIGHVVVRTLKREMVKLWYFLTRGLLVAIGLFILSFIPFINLLVPALALLWGAWVMTLQYADYPADNHQISFKRLRTLLKKHTWSTLGFGGSIMLGSMIPVVNIFIMPIAVAGGTVLWSKELSAPFSSTNTNVLQHRF